MSQTDLELLTPIFHKTDETAEPPEDTPVCHVLAGNGLFIRRKHPFFTSCVVSRGWPAELAKQQQYLNLHCPKVPQAEMERIVGFFSMIARLHGSEAAVILLWDRRRERVSFEVPDQTATVSECWNGVWSPTDVRYKSPEVGADLSVFGSVHSHVEGWAYSSKKDITDESYRTGLHIVVGQISREPPHFHCEYVVDGVRFVIGTREVIEGYERRDTEVPDEWIERVKVDVERYKSETTFFDGRHDRGPARREIH